MKINVTQRDIDMGEPGMVCRCPIARALCRGLKKKLGTITVFLSNASVDGCDWMHLPEECVAFQKRFDNGNVSCGPFSFEVGLPK